MLRAARLHPGTTEIYFAYLATAALTFFFITAVNCYENAQPQKKKYTSKCTKSVHGEEAPFKESRTQNLKSRYKQLYNLPRWDLGVAGHLNPVTYNYKLAKRLIAKYVNKPVDEAYSDYCDKCKSELKEFFWNLFQEEFDTRPETFLNKLKYKLVDGIIRHK